MTTPDPHTNNPCDLVPHLVPDLVPDVPGAHVETTSSPVPSSSIGDEVSEPPRPRPTTSSQHRDEHPQQHPVETVSNPMDPGASAEPHGPGLVEMIRSFRASSFAQLGALLEAAGEGSAAGKLHDDPHDEGDREDHAGEDGQDDDPLGALGLAEKGVHGESVVANQVPYLVIEEIQERLDGDWPLHESHVRALLAEVDRVTTALAAERARAAAGLALADEWEAATCIEDGAPCSFHRQAPGFASDLRAALTAPGCEVRK